MTTTVGWLPKPAELLRARWRFAEGEIQADELQRVERRASLDAIALQETLGLDLLVDGQMDRGDMAASFAEGIEGMEPAGLVRCFGNRYYRRPRIVDEVRRTGSITVESWKAAQQRTSKPVKAILTGPYTLMHWSFDEHYGSRERCCTALAELVRAEAEELVQAGATDIEIDEPAISSRPEELVLAATALDRVTEPLRGRVRTWTYVGCGERAPLIDRLLRLPVDGLLLEMTGSEFELLEVLGDLPEGKLLGAGVVDVHAPAVESVGTVRSRVARLLAKIPAERLWLIPDGGLRTLDAETARAKLQALVQAAASV